MGISPEKKGQLERICECRRRELIQLLHRAGSGHPGGSLSAVEIITTLYYEKMDISKIKQGSPDRDRFILGKGHAAPVLYLTLAELGFFPREDLNAFRQVGSHLQGHPCAGKTRGVELSTGPLGLGLPAGVGISLSGRMDGLNYNTYVLMGDGEIQEGIIWEAAMCAAKYGLDRLVGIVDYNGVQLDGPLEKIMPLGDVEAKWKAFGWNVLIVDGHDVRALSDAIDEAKNAKGKPMLILAHTVKGKGVSFMEGRYEWHGKPLGDAAYKNALKELGGDVDA